MRTPSHALSVAALTFAACGGGGSGGGGNHVDAANPAHKRVFITSTTYSGDLATASGTPFETQDSGVVGANLLCQNAATAGVLGGTWKAIVYQPGGGLDALADAGPWHRVDGMLAFNNRAQLKTTPTVALTIDELGHDQTASASQCVWTGMMPGGAPNPGCALQSDVWTFANSAQNGVKGRVGASDSAWIYDGDTNCNGPCHLYCIEQ